MEVRHRDNQDLVVADLVNEPVREPVEQVPAGVLAQRMPREWVVSDALYPGTYLLAELTAEACPLTVVVADTLTEFLAGSREEAYSHYCSHSANTSSAEKACT